MVKRESTAPFLFFILDLPSGISSGFASITLPFILTQAGFSVAAAGYIVALGVSANLWRFLWGPVADFTLSARRWYLIGLVTTAVTLLLLGLIPLRPDSTGLLNAVVFISQVASTLVMLPLGGLMAHTVSDDMKGRAAGCIRPATSEETESAAVPASGWPRTIPKKSRHGRSRSRCSPAHSLSFLYPMFALLRRKRWSNECDSSARICSRSFGPRCRSLSPCWFAHLLARAA
jgi:hypothetical protein